MFQQTIAKNMSKLPFYINLILMQKEIEFSYLFLRTKKIIQWTFPLLDKILKNIEIGKNITIAWKRIPSLLKLRSLVVKCCKL